ncbi:MAG: hypothetical protein JXQ73_04745 [Phycisphaerae bacterium]|nr:hypothetical protein [Phycisphaerae bacterium]
MPGFVSLEDAKKRLKKSEEELRLLADNGKINLVQDGDEIWISEADVDDLKKDGDKIDLDLVVADEDQQAEAPKPAKPERKKDRQDKMLEARAMSDTEALLSIGESRKDGQPDLADVPIALEPEDDLPPQEDGMSKIKSFAGKGIQAARQSRDGADFKRGVNKSGQGATRSRTFHAKLNDSSLAYMDQLINEWIDGDPEVEIKFATSSVGVVEGKHAEPHLIITVFY